MGEYHETVLSESTMLTIFLDHLEKILGVIGSWIWGYPLMILLLGTGIFLTVRLKGLQFTNLFHALWLALIKRKEKGEAAGDITHFQALMTALAATVGVGNIAGVATAIASGGPGALFWMWITGLFGMATKYSEAVLAVKYRETDSKGNMSGGPMYYISKGLNQKWLGVLFAIFASIAAFGIGNMVQSNSVADTLNHTFKIPFWITGVALCILTALVILGGIKSIGKVTGTVIPFMIVFYMGGALLIIFLNIEEVPAVIRMVFEKAFTPQGAAGGFLGVTVQQTIRFGLARGLFSNESGLGSSPIAAAAAKTKDPATQALVSMTQTFIDTIIVCSLTGFAILSSGLWKAGLTGAELTTAAFSKGLPGQWGGYIVSVGIVFFAYSTLLGWSYYGEKSIQYLLGDKSVMPYRILFCLFIFIGAVVKLNIVWSFSDIANGLMALPNLIGLLLLSPVIVSETRRYLKERKS